VGSTGVFLIGDGEGFEETSIGSAKGTGLIIGESGGWLSSMTLRVSRRFLTALASLGVASREDRTFAA
jgi:hypothetical protein